MAKRYEFSYEDFTPLYTSEGKRDPGRRFVDTSTGQIIGKSSFYEHATKRERTPEELSAYTPRVSRSETGLQSGGRLTTEQKRDRYQDTLTRYTDRVNEMAKAGLGDPITRNQARQSADFKIMYQAYKNSKDREKHGARHNALIFLGILDEDDDYY